MKSILSRVLSQEIRHQEQWKEQDVEMFGEHMAGPRNLNIKEIKNFMEENDIEFNYEWYIRA